MLDLQQPRCARGFGVTPDTPVTPQENGMTATPLQVRGGKPTGSWELYSGTSQQKDSVRAS